MSDVTTVSDSKNDEHNLVGTKTLQDLDFLEIDLSKYVNLLWQSRVTILFITGIFAILGLFHYITAPEEFESEATLIQEVEATGNFDGGNALLRTLTGSNFSIGGGGNLSAAARGRAPLPANLYPLIVNSTDFQKNLIYMEVEFSTLGKSISLYEYFTDYYQPPFRDRAYSLIGDYTIFLPYTIISGVRRGVSNIRSSISSSDLDSTVEQIEQEDTTELTFDDRLLHVSNRERAVIERMRQRIEITVGGSTTSIKTTLPDPKASAIVSALLVDRIQEFMTDYRVEKARQNLDDIKQQYEDARERYEQAQFELAEYQDSNINVRSAVFATRQEHLRDQRNLRYTIYSSLAQEVEQARMTVQQEMPIFNMLEKPLIPHRPSTGSSDLILVFSVILGFFFGVGWVLIRNLFAR